MAIGNIMTEPIFRSGGANTAFGSDLQFSANAAALAPRQTPLRTDNRHKCPHGQRWYDAQIQMFFDKTH